MCVQVNVHNSWLEYHPGNCKILGSTDAVVFIITIDVIIVSCAASHSIWS